jgi:hypothetical protein
MAHVLDRVSAPLRGWSSRRALRASRRSADEELVASRLPSPRLAWRIAELTGEDNRVALGRSVTDVVRHADERLLPSASPIDRATVRACRAQLLELASRLFDADRPVAPRGVLLVDRLLTEPDSPLYDRGGPRQLRLELKRLGAALDGRELDGVD